MKFLQNCWYVIARSNELGSGQLLARTLLNVPVVVFRNEDGSVSARHDRCPHRYAPLRLGRLAKGGVQCGYHGLVFGSTGACIHNPRDGKDNHQLELSSARW